jgi:hypothetical protein
MHGGFLAGIGIQAIFAAAFLIQAARERSARKPFLMMTSIAAVSVAVTFVNPFGASLHQMLWHHLVTHQFVREWQSLWQAGLSPVYCAPFILLLLALPGWRRLRIVDVLLLLVIGYQAICHIRHIALLNIAVLVLLPAALSEGLNRLFPNIRVQWTGPERRWLRAGAVSMVLVSMLALQLAGSYKFWRHGIGPLDVAMETRSDVPGMPLAAVSLIREAGLRGNLLTDYGWGQFAIWHLHPQVQVAFDGRYRTVYPEELEQQFLAFQQANRNPHRGAAMLDNFETDMVLLPVARAACHYMDQRDDWVRVYQDKQSALYVAKHSGLDSMIAKCRRSQIRSTHFTKWTSFPGGHHSSRTTGTQVSRLQRTEVFPCASDLVSDG